MDWMLIFLWRVKTKRRGSSAPSQGSNHMAIFFLSFFHLTPL
jgi:hypothetical protein